MFPKTRSKFCSYSSHDFPSTLVVSFKRWLGANLEFFNEKNADPEYLKEKRLEKSVCTSNASLRSMMLNYSYPFFTVFTQWLIISFNRMFPKYTRLTTVLQIYQMLVFPIYRYCNNQDRRSAFRFFLSLLVIPVKSCISLHIIT